MSASTRSCEFCDKRGLPVMPVRYALAEIVGRVPKLTAPMTADEVAAIPDSSKAQYTARLLRSGYLYTYDEARKRWEGYFINDGGYYLRFDIKQAVSPALGKARQPCTDEGHQEIASCITIRDPKNATKVWFGFSDVEWTPAVLEKHAAADYRKRHMRLLDVKAWLSSKQQPHAKPIEKIADTIAEYTRLMLPHKSAFGWSPFKFNNRQTKTESLIKTAEQLAPNGLILGIPDPAGIAQELAALMSYRQSVFMEKPERKYRITIAGVIGQMEAAIKDEAQRSNMAAAEELANDAQTGMHQTYSGGWMPGQALTPDPKLAAQYRNVTNSELERVASEEWKKYLKKLKWQEKTEWSEGFKNEFKTFDTEQIVPLVNAHVAWMKSTVMTNYFDCNFDPHNVETGLVYTAVFGNCIAGTSDKKACGDLYTAWLLGDVSDTKNLLLCGLTLNQKLIKEAILSAATNSVSWGELAWDKLIQSFEDATKSLINGHPDVLGRLVGLVSGSVANALRQGAQSNRVYSGLVAIGAAARQPIVRVEVTGSKKAFRAILIKELLRQSGTHLPPNKIKRAVAAELKRLEILGVKLEGTEKKQWLLMIDPAEVARMPKDLSVQARAQWLAKSIRTPEDIEALNLHKFRTTVSQVSGQVNSAVRYSSPMGFAFLGVVANAVALNSLLDADAKALMHTQSESLRRVYAQGMQLVGAAGSVIETGLEKMVLPLLKYGRGVATSIARLIGSTSMRLGVVGSLAMGIFDLWQANTERAEGNYVGMVAYGAAGILGIAATVLLAIGWTGWGLIAVIALIAWAFIMNYLIDNKLQDWLERCIWGNLVEKRYNNLDLEMSELKVATGA